MLGRLPGGGDAQNETSRKEFGRDVEGIEKL